MSDDVPDRPPAATMIDALDIRRNVRSGLAVGVSVAVLAYIVRVFELLGPVGGAREYPVFGPEAWFVLLAVVFAAATALGVTVVLTAFRLYQLTSDVADGDTEEQAE